MMRSARSAVALFLALLAPTYGWSTARAALLGGRTTIVQPRHARQIGGGLLRMPTVRRTVRAVAGGADASAPQTYEGARIGPPPDLPSLLLNNRIVYIGMPLVPAVTELVVAELLYLNYESSTKPVYMYINSPGTVSADGRSVAFETEAFAIADCMKYIKPKIHTICLGQAFGAAAMLLSQGAKGHRACLPNASIMMHQPRSMARGQASDIAIKAKEVMTNRQVTCELIARACGKDVETVMKDAGRTKYLSPDEAVEYGLIDKVLSSTKYMPIASSLSPGQQTGQQKGLIS